MPKQFRTGSSKTTTWHRWWYCCRVAEGERRLKSCMCTLALSQTNGGWRCQFPVTPNGWPLSSPCMEGGSQLAVQRKAAECKVCLGTLGTGCSPLHPTRLERASQYGKALMHARLQVWPLAAYVQLHSAEQKLSQLSRQALGSLWPLANSGSTWPSTSTVVTSS